MPDTQVLQHRFLKTVLLKRLAFLKTILLLPSALPPFSLAEGTRLCKKSVAAAGFLHISELTQGHAEPK